MRRMRQEEIFLVQRIIGKDKSLRMNLELLSNLWVEDLDDGGMGGLFFVSENKDRSLGRDVGAEEFADKDGVKVIATLSLDNFGELYELDIWKTDFSKLMALPK